MPVAWNPFRRVLELVDEAGTANTRPVGTLGAISSPWTTGTLSQVVWSDIFGADWSPVTRAEAMRVPAIVKGRGLVAGTLARLPLAAYSDDVKLEGTDKPTWLYRTSSGQSPYQRMLWTFDDLIFGGTSLWTVDRNAAGRVVNALRVPPEWWEITPDLNILVQGQEVTEESVILFEAPQDGLLTIAQDDIRAALDMTRSWASRVKSPVPLAELHHTDENNPLEPEEITDLVQTWETARAAGGATGYTPQGIQLITHGEASTDLYVNGRNASRLDFANYLQVPASLLEGSSSTASLTYSTQEGQRNELVDYSLYYWAAAVEARLSLDDVVPRGQRVAFDVSWFVTPTTPTGSPAVED